MELNNPSLGQAEPLQVPNETTP